MKKKDIADSGAQYAGTQPIQHAEVVLGQAAAEPAKPEQKPKASVVNKTEKSTKTADQARILPTGRLPETDRTGKSENPRIRKAKPKPIL